MSWPELFANARDMIPMSKVMTIECSCSNVYPDDFSEAIQ